MREGGGVGGARASGIGQHEARVVATRGPGVALRRRRVLNQRDAGIGRRLGGVFTWRRAGVRRGHRRILATAVASMRARAVDAQVVGAGVLVVAVAVGLAGAHQAVGICRVGLAVAVVVHAVRAGAVAPGALLGGGARQAGGLALQARRARRARALTAGHRDVVVVGRAVAVLVDAVAGRVGERGGGAGVLAAVGGDLVEVDVSGLAGADAAGSGFAACLGEVEVAGVAATAVQRVAREAGRRVLAAGAVEPVAVAEARRATRDGALAGKAGRGAVGGRADRAAIAAGEDVALEVLAGL